MRCDEIETLLVAYLDGEVEPSERTAIEAHLADCPRCTEKLHALAQTKARVEKGLGALAARAAVPADAWERLQGGIAADRSEKAPSTPEATPPAAPRPATAAAAEPPADVKVLRTHPARRNGAARRNTPRMLALAAAVVVVLVGLGFGVNALVDHLSHDRTVVIATDDTMRPDSPATTTPSASEQFEDIWAASVAAVDALGPTRVTIDCTVESSEGPLSLDPSAWPTVWRHRVEGVQLFDTPNKRALLRLIDDCSPDMKDSTFTPLITPPSNTVLVNGRERTTIVQEEQQYISRQVSLEEPTGLPMPLWVMAVQDDSYAYLFHDENGVLCTEGSSAEPLPDGGWQLSWTQSEGLSTISSLLLLDDRLLPTRLRQDLDWKMGDSRTWSSFVIDYRFEEVSSFEDSDFALELPDDGEDVPYSYSRELSLDHPRAEEADWGQYWLGRQMGDWSLVDAHYSHVTSYLEDFSYVGLLYVDQEAYDEREIHMMIYSRDEESAKESQKAYEEQAPADRPERREIMLNGRPAIAYIEEIEATIFAPDAFISIQTWRPETLQMALDALQPVK